MADILPPGAQALKDLPYGNHGASTRMDLFLPKKSQAPAPVVIWIHGGGWERNSKEPNPLMFLVDKGYAVVGIDFRQSGAAPFPAQIHDCKEAVRYLRANAAKYHLDPDRIGAFGASSGGHLAALLGTSGDVKALDPPKSRYPNVSCAVQAVCDVSGPTDLVTFANARASVFGFPPDQPMRIVTRLIGGPLDRKEAVARSASPIRYVSPKTPPFLIVHGEEDNMVPLDQSRVLVDALKKAGAPVELTTLPGVKHDTAGKVPLRPLELFFDRSLRGLEAPSPAIDTEVRQVASFPMGDGADFVPFYSNGRFGTTSAPQTWCVEGDKIVLCYYDHDQTAPNWIKVETYKADAFDSEGKLRDAAERAPAGDPIPAGYASENVMPLATDAALGRAMGGRWARTDGGYSMPLGGATPQERKESALQFKAVLGKELGSTEGLTVTENSIAVSDALAKKITDKFTALQTAPGQNPADFTRKFSGAGAPLTQSNFLRTKADAQRLAEAAAQIQGLEKPTVKMDRMEAVLTFKDQAQADKFAALLKDAAKQTGLASVRVDVPRDRKTVSLALVELSTLSEREAKALFDKVNELAGKGKAKEEPEKTSAATAPGFIRGLQTAVTQLEQQFGAPQQPLPPPERGQLPSPRLVAVATPDDKGSPRL